MLARWLAFTVWAAVAASGVYWGMKFFVPAVPAPAHAGVAAPAPALRGDLTRLLGADPPPKVVEAVVVPSDSARFQLLGVVTPRSRQAGGQGIALIAVDGKPARAFKVGAVIDGEQLLQAVQARAVSIGPRGGAPTVSLELPALPPASTGSLPPALPGSPPASAAPKPAIALPVVRPPMPGVNRFPGLQPPQAGGAGGGSAAEPPAQDGPALR